MQTASFATKIHFCARVMSANLMPGGYLNCSSDWLGLAIADSLLHAALQECRVVLGALHGGEFQREVEGFHERLGLQRLGEVLEEARLQRLDDGFGSEVGAERQDGRGFGGRV